MRSSPGPFSRGAAAALAGCVSPAAKATSSSSPAVIGLNPELCPGFLGCFFPCNLGLRIWDDATRNAMGCGYFLPLAESWELHGAGMEPTLRWLGTPSGLPPWGGHRGFLLPRGHFKAGVCAKEPTQEQATCFLPCLYPSIGLFLIFTLALKHN